MTTAIDTETITDPDDDTLAQVLDMHPNETRAEALADLTARFRVEDDRQATWAMRKARKAAQRIREVDAIAAEEIERIQAWAVKERKRPEQDLNFFSGLLTDYALRVRAEDPKRKSVVTPYGTVQTRSKAIGWEVDEDTFLAWAKTNRPDLVKTTEKPLLAEAKKALTADENDLLVTTPEGEIVPGITLTPAGLTATVTPEV